MAVSATPPAICGGAPRPVEPPVLAREVFDTLVNGGAGTGSRCEMVEIHGAKVASFRVRGRELVCLPQVFELFLKHLVGGLHTVYTKLKRLDICPVVCTVEQVRALRGLGAIQPGVNRCKLIAREDFEALYSDCTSASSRPGRPPKRSVGGTAQDGPRLLYPGVPGLLPPGFLSSTGLTTAAMSEAMKLHKMKLMALNRLHGRDSQNSGECEQEERSSSAGGSECSWEKERLQSPALNAAQYKRLQQNHHPGAPSLDLPFVVMPHPLLPVSLPPASVAMAMSQMNHLNTMANMAAAAQMCRAGASVIKEHVQDSPSSVPFIGEPQHLLPQPSSHPSSSASSSPASNHRTTDHLMVNTPNGDLTDMDNASRVKSAVSEKEDFKLAIPVAKPGFNKQVLPPGFTTPFLFADDLTSLETLLTNIQGLLKVAVENARKQEKRIQQEKKELKMELFREREMRENLERQLTSELQSRAAIQRRLKREKKAKRKLQEALEFESKRREQAEQALQRAGLSDGSCQSFSTAPLIQRAAPCASLHPALNGGLLVQQDTVSGSLCGAPFIQRGTMSDGLGSAPLVQRGTSCDGLGRSSLTQRTTSPDALRSSTSEAVLLEEEPEHNGSPQEKPAAQGNRGNIKTAMDH